MGCNVQKKSIVVQSKIQIKGSDTTKRNFSSINLNSILKFPYYKKETIELYQNKITQKNWKKVLDYLPYQDLKEVGKVNRKFNNYIKSNEILVKFFKKKENQYIKIINKREFASFSQLKNSFYSNCTIISVE